MLSLKILCFGGTGKRRLRITLIREFAAKHEIEFPVGVSVDESTQNAYGATALPMFALIDRAGVVRSFAFSPDDENFTRVLEECLGQEP